MAGLQRLDQGAECGFSVLPGPRIGREGPGRALDRIFQPGFEDGPPPGARTVTLDGGEGI